MGSSKEDQPLSCPSVVVCVKDNIMGFLIPVFSGQTFPPCLLIFDFLSVVSVMVSLALNPFHTTINLSLKFRRLDRVLRSTVTLIYSFLHPVKSCMYISC